VINFSNLYFEISKICDPLFSEIRTSLSSSRFRRQGTVADKDIAKVSVDPEIIANIQTSRRLNEIPSSINLTLAKALSMDLLSLIRNRYELNGKGKMLFLTATNMGSHVWDILKYKFAKKALDQNKTFHMIFGGDC